MPFPVWSLISYPEKSTVFSLQSFLLGKWNRSLDLLILFPTLPPYKIQTPTILFIFLYFLLASNIHKMSLSTMVYIPDAPSPQIFHHVEKTILDTSPWTKPLRFLLLFHVFFTDKVLMSSS